MTVALESLSFLAFLAFLIAMVVLVGLLVGGWPTRRRCGRQPGQEAHNPEKEEEYR
jgi:hypothetical protein